MKNRFIVSVILIMALVLSVTLLCLAGASNNNEKPQNNKQGVKGVFQNIGQSFKDAKNKTVKNTKDVKKGVVKGFKGAKNQVKQDAKNVKRGFVNGFKSLKK